ncbi:uncharacterized protein LOC110099129 isoform X4 [Dendrobium catenatum]|uniref:uncharacterized protein LOC110099129 isoform X4 n=1 Tax=Dendrobium catenatum TaxID=906689 RepID=UPI0009F5FC1E|nr:uncharacterized protein LOC110099129 isoform X4 [Dendrobium catenatum]
MISRRGYCNRRHITPVLKGSCRIQGPVDDLDLKDMQGTDSDFTAVIILSYLGAFQDDKKFMFPKDLSSMRIESGTCTVCSAPCSSCMHHNRESGVSCNLSVRTDADSSSVSNVDVIPIYKSRTCDDLQPAASEASNLLSSTSSHDSYGENSESKTSLRACAGYDASDDIDMPQVFSVEARRCAEIDNVECSLVMEGNLNLQPQAEIDNVNYSLASSSGGNSPETKSGLILNHEVSTTWTKSGFSSGISNINGLCQDTRSGTDCKKPSDNCSEDCHVNDLERDDSVLDTVKGQNLQMQPQASTVGENYESDVALDDVKVCDICGDAGREDYLATCSKCSDGAEHTYCMREMLDKVPEGEWLCEECKIKETESQNANECEAAYGRLKSICPNDINQDFMSPLIPMQTNKFDATPTDLDARGSAKGLQGPHISIRRPVDPLVEGKASELSGASIEKASPGEKPVLSRQISSKKLDMGKMKAARMEPSSEAQLAKGSEAFSCSKTYLKSSSFKGLPPLYSPRGRLSRSVSFNNSNVNPKVKTLIENAPPKQKITRDPNEFRKEGLFKTSTKPMFKNITSECSNTDLASKNPLLQPSRTEDLRALKEVKDRNTVEKKNFSVKGNSFIRPSAAITSNYPLKVDAKSVQSDGIKNNVSDASICSLSEGLNADSLGSNEGKKQVSYSSKNIESSSGNYDADYPKGFKVTTEALRRSISSVDGSYRKVEIVSPRRAVQPLESGHKDRRTRDSTIFIGSKLSTLGDNGRTIQYKRGGSARRTSADQNSRGVEKKGNKWREVVNAAMTKSGILKGGKSDTLVEVPAISADMICEGASKHTSSAFNQRSLVVENNIGKVSSKNSADVSTKTVASIGLAQLAVLPVKASGKADGTRDAPNATELSVKSVAKTLQGEASLLTKPGSAVPKLECIWQGSFNVIGTGNHSKMFFGIQAHLSTFASPRVYKLATKVPGNVQLEEVSHISSWPLQLLRTGPQDENIALFFFAKDVESYDRSYRKLMDKMHRNDLALRGNIEGTELLIFTSNKLPMNSQRWNKMHYLWGMFRGKRRYYLPVMGDQKKSLLSNQDFFVPPIADVSNVQSLETSSKLKKLSDFISSKVVYGEHTNGVDLPPISSIIEDKTRKTPEVSPVQNLLSEVHAVPNVTQEKPSFSVSSSSGTKAEPLRVTSDYPNSRLQMTTTNSCSEEKNNGTYQEKFVGGCTNRKAGNSYVLTYETGVESSLRKAPSVPSVSPNCNEGADCINIEENSGEKETSLSVRAIIDDDQRGNVLGEDLVGCESSTANRKRERSCSMERISEPSGEISKNTIETVLLRDGPSWFPVEDESEQKKTCYNSGSSDINDTTTSARLSSKVHPLYSTIIRQEQPVESLCKETLKPQNVRNTERCFFQIDLGPVQNGNCTNIIQIPSKEEENLLESSSPDLELALGGKSKPTKLFSFPSLFHSVDGGKQNWQPGSPGDGDDASASLSLSL